MFWVSPALSILVSVIYFRSSPRDQSLSRRLLVSAHGVILALIYIGAIIVWQAGCARTNFGEPFAIILAVPLVFTLATFLWFRGPRYIHLIQFVNLFCLAVTFLIGGMAVTGNWL
jgi:hypothetical protein